MSKSSVLIQNKAKSCSHKHLLSNHNYYIILGKHGEMWLETQPINFGIFSHDLKITGIRGRAAHRICSSNSACFKQHANLCFTSLIYLLIVKKNNEKK